MKNKKLIIIVIALVVVIAAGVFAYLMFFSGDKEEDAQAPEVLTYFETGEYLVTNLTDENTLVKLTVVLGVTEEADQELLTLSIAAIRDRIVYVMRGHSKEDFVDNSSLDALSEEISQAINAELGVDYVRRAYFYDFVVQ